MGVAGAYLAMAQFNAFTFGVISGRGWVCIALVVFGQWRPWGSALNFGPRYCGRIFRRGELCFRRIPGASPRLMRISPAS
jgi:hypothetical protein